MIARITRYRIRPGKLEEFTAKVDAVVASIDKLQGFRGLIVLAGENPDDRDVTAISMWDSVEEMKSSESSDFYYDAIMKITNCCESFSPMHQHTILKTKFPSGQG